MTRTAAAPVCAFSPLFDCGCVFWDKTSFCRPNLLQAFTIGNRKLALRARCVRLCSMCWLAPIRSLDPRVWYGMKIKQVEGPPCRLTLLREESA